MNTLKIELQQNGLKMEKLMLRDFIRIEAKVISINALQICNFKNISAKV